MLSDVRMCSNKWEDLPFDLSTNTTTLSPCRRLSSPLSFHSGLSAAISFALSWEAASTNLSLQSLILTKENL